MKDTVGAKGMGHYNYDLSINKIYDVINPREEKHAIKRAVLEELQKQIQSLIIGAEILSTTQKLKVLEVHSTDARHGCLGSKAYTKERFIKFAREVELDKPGGWIFQWLAQLSCIR